MNPRSLLLKLMPVSALAIALVALSATTAPKADATVSTVFASPNAIASGGSSSITLSSTDDSGTLTISVANAISAQLSLTGCSGGDGSVTVSSCQINSSGNGTSVVSINTGGLDADATPQLISVNLSLTASCTPNTTMTVNAVDGTNGQAAQIFCTGATASWVTVSSSSVTCGGIVTVNAIPPGAIIGTPITFAASGGSFNPTSVVYTGGSATSTFTAPSTTGTVVFTVTNGSTSGTAVVNVTCAAPTAIPTTAPVVVAPQPTAIPQPIAQIVPPNTGDGGLR